MPEITKSDLALLNATLAKEGKPLVKVNNDPFVIGMSPYNPRPNVPLAKRMVGNAPAPKPASNAGMKNQDKNFKGSYSNTDDLKRMQAASLSRQQGRSNLTSEDLKPKAAAQAEAPKVQAPKAEAPKPQNRNRLRATGRNEMLEENLRRARSRAR